MGIRLLLRVGALNIRSLNCGSDFEVAATVRATRAALDSLDKAASSEAPVATLHLLDITALTAVLRAKVPPSRMDNASPLE